jgi:transcriptional regulator with XRE-family HTH domain
MSKIRPNNFDAGAAAAARAAAGLTQQQVADAVGKTKALVQHWEAGRRQPYPEITRALADLYGVDVEDLLVSPLELAMADMAMVRRAQRISVDEMAERIGVSTRSIEQVEAGARMPDDPIAWAAGYKVSLPALATAWRNTPAPIAESLEPVGGRRIEPGPISPVTTALATAYDAEPERLQVSAPDLDHDDLGMVRRRARISGEQMAMRVMAPGDPAPKLRELYRVEAASYLPSDPVRWARAYGLSVRGLAACWRRGWIGPHGGAGKHTVDLRDGDDRPPGRPGRG